MRECPPITIVIHELRLYGGQERATYELARRFLERGAEVTVIARKCELPADERLRWIRVRGPRRPFLFAYPWFFLIGTIATAIYARGFRQAAGAIILNKVDAVTVHCCHHGYSRVPAAETRGRASVLHTVSAYLSSRCSRWAERLCFRPSRVQALVAVSSGMADELRRFFPRMASRVVVIPNGVDRDQFRPDAEARTRVRSAVGIGEDDPVAVFVGGAWERKGVPIALAGVAATDNWHLLVGGAGDAHELCRLADRERAGARLHLYGSGEGMRPAELMAAGDAFVFPTSYEGFSLATLEAAATGLPLLMSRVHGGAELVIEGETGWFIERSPESIRSALDALAGDADLRRRMGERVRRVADAYTWDEAASKYESLMLESQLGDRAPIEVETTEALEISVIVPTYERPAQLMECLEGLDDQTLQPLEILIVVRREDRQTRDALASRRNGAIRAVEVEGGYVTALNAGLAAADGEVIAFIDDDAVPRPDWLERVQAHFLRDPEVGGLGGRDLIPDDPGPVTSNVGSIAWYGRLVGQHHRGFGPQRPVEVLKGVNMAFRAAAVDDLEFDRNLLGKYMQPHSEIGFCLALRRRGWKLIYDPAVLVDHDMGVRQYDTQRGSGAYPDVFMEAHNELLGLATGLSSVRRAIAVAYSLFVGSRKYPGPVLALERLVFGGEGWQAVRRLRAATAGRLRALVIASGWRRREAGAPSAGPAAGEGGPPPG